MRGLRRGGRTTSRASPLLRWWNRWICINNVANSYFNKKYHLLQKIQEFAPGLTDMLGATLRNGLDCVGLLPELNIGWTGEAAQYSPKRNTTVFTMDSLTNGKISRKISPFSGEVAQRWSSGLISHWLWVRIPPSPPEERPALNGRFLHSMGAVFAALLTAIGNGFESHPRHPKRPAYSGRFLRSTSRAVFAAPLTAIWINQPKRRNTHHR